MKKILLAIIVAMTAMAANAQFWVGGSLGLNFFKAEDSFSDVITHVKIAPEVGYKLNNKWELAAAFNESFTVFDGDIYNSFSVEPYARFTFAKAGIASFFVDGGFGLGARGFDDDNFFTRSRFEFYIGLRPGVKIRLSEKVGLVSKLGFIGYEYIEGIYHRAGINLNDSPLTLGMYYNF